MVPRHSHPSMVPSSAHNYLFTRWSVLQPGEEGILRKQCCVPVETWWITEEVVGESFILSEEEKDTLWNFSTPRERLMSHLGKWSLTCGTKEFIRGLLLWNICLGGGPLPLQIHFLRPWCLLNQESQSEKQKAARSLVF